MDITQILIQAPIVGLVVWLVLMYNKRFDAQTLTWHTYLKERNGKLEKTLDNVTASNDRMCDLIDRNTKVLIHITTKNGIEKEVEDLLK